MFIIQEFEVDEMKIQFYLIKYFENINIDCEKYFRKANIKLNITFSGCQNSLILICLSTTTV